MLKKSGLLYCTLSHIHMGMSMSIIVIYLQQYKNN